MTVSQNDGLPTTFQAQKRSTALNQQVASVISQIGSPPVIVTFMVLFSATSSPDLSGWIWGTVYLLLAVAVPMVRLIWLVQHGFITDLDVQLRKQRIGPLLHTLAMGGLTSGIMLLGGAPARLQTLVVTLWVLEVLILGITLRWKISVHSAMSAAAALFVWHYLGLMWVPLTGVVLIIWSRIHLQRHTVLQTLAGGALGAIVFHLAIIIGNV